MPILFVLNCLPMQLNEVVSRNSQSTAIDSSYIYIQHSVFNAISNHLYQEQISLIQYPSQGNYEWCYTDGNSHFNSSTFDFVSASLSEGTMPYTLKLSSSGGFVNAYSSLLSSTYYGLSTSAQKAIQDLKSGNMSLIKNIVLIYETDYGQITDQDMEKARSESGKWISEKIDYIIQYEIAGIWSGMIRNNKQLLTYQDLEKSTDLDTLLPFRKPNSNAILSLVKEYLQNISQVNRYIDDQSQANWILNDAIDNVEHPDNENGGVLLINPLSNKTSGHYQPSFTMEETIEEIETKLKKEKIDARCLIVNNDQNGINVEITLLQNQKQNTISYTIDHLELDNTTSSIGFSLRGITMIDVSPNLWHDNPTKGWFIEYIIKSAIENDKSDVSGYQFVLSKTYDLSSPESGGDFGYIDKILVCDGFKAAIGILNNDINTYKANDKQSVYIHSDPDVTSHIVPGTDPTTFQVQYSFNEPANDSIPNLQQEAYVLGIKGVFPPDY